MPSLRGEGDPQATTTLVDDLASRFSKIFSQQKEETIMPKVIRPWESWELDEEFFQTLSRWTIDNPERPLDRVLDNVRDRIESLQDFMQAIPDSPFPARSLVIALASLLKLGVTVRRAQKDVQDFAKDVIQWVGLVKSSFESANDQTFARRAWRDLKHMRELVDKICLWAVERLTDGRWLRIGHGLMIQKEIGEFNERVANARALFQDLSAINLARGLDAIMTKLRKVALNQQTIIGEIQTLRTTQKKQLDRIMGEMEKRKQEAERERFFARTLDAHAIVSPTYDSQGKRPCDSDTRVDVLDDIRKWRNDIKRGSSNFLWLTGNPGCGKSAVTASFARECKDEGVLWAQFFINRNNAETTDPRSYFPSIARQLADYSSEVAEAIQHILVQRRSLADDISADQAAYLFASSIRKASELDPDRPVVVVIDGLDETKHERLEDTAEIFSTLFTTLHTHSNVKIFISSRTEDEIQRSFVRTAYDKHVKRVHLDTADPSSMQDVAFYIKRNLLHLVKKHDLNWAVWPGDERSQILGQRASGLFIWGVTAIKFIQEQLSSHGEERLDKVLDMLTADVLKDINALYILILKVTHGDQEDEWELERFRRIVGAIVFLQEPLCINELAALLDLRETPFSRPVDIPHFVRRFRTILVSGTDAVNGETIPRIHKSVFEFITSNRVDPKFRVEPAEAHLELAVQCLAHLGTVEESIIEDTLPVLVRYAARFWSFHLLQAKPVQSMVLYNDHRSSPCAISPLVNTANSTHPVGKPLQIRSSAETSDITVAVEWPVTWDAISGTHTSYGHKYHEDDVKGIVFSLGGGEIVSCSNDKSIQICDMMNDRETHTLVNHTRKLFSLAFSPDGKSIATGSDDGSIHIWEYSTGVPIGQPLRGHKDIVYGIAFSSDGRRIVSGSRDKTCILWDVQNGQAIGECWTGHDSWITHVAFSSSSQRVCSVDFDGYYIIWDASTGKKVRHGNIGQDPTCSSFSPTNDDVIAVGCWGGILIGRSYNRQYLVPDSTDTRCLEFLPNGKQVIFSTHDTISVAGIGGDEETRITRKGQFPRADSMFSAAFSPTLDYFAYADLHDAIHLFALHHTKTSLKVIPIDKWSRTKLSPHINRAKELKDALSSMKNASHINNAVQTTNRRLRGITWYEADSVEAVKESALRAYVVWNDVVLAGYRDGLTLVWNQHGIKKNKE